MNNLNVWEDEEVKSLFKFVEVKKSEGVPLIKIFNLFAKCVNRKQNSVRNYYYREIKNLKENKNRELRLGINLKNHIAKTPEPFSEKDTKEVVSNIKSLLEQGYSVRGACLELAGGDAGKMVRYQNKYRAEVKYKQNEKEKNEGIKSNVIKMPVKSNILSDDDISALFLGLVKMVKKQAEVKAKMLVEGELKRANENLKLAILEIASKKHEIERLKNQIVVLEKDALILEEQKTIKNVKIAKIMNSANTVMKKFIEQKSIQLNKDNTLQNG